MSFRVRRLKKTESLGAQLKTLRQKQFLTLEHAAEKTKIQLIAMKRWGAIPLDFDYYQAEIGIEEWGVIKMILFAAYPYGKLNGLTQKDLLYLLIPLYRDTYGVSPREEPYKMTMEGLKNKPFIGQKPGFDIGRLAIFKERKILRKRK